MPFYLCSTVFMLAAPSAAIADPSSVKPAKHTTHHSGRTDTPHQAAKSAMPNPAAKTALPHTSVRPGSIHPTGRSEAFHSVAKAGSIHSAGTAILSKDRKTMSLQEKQGMHFVHAYVKNNDEDLLVIKRRSEIPFSIIDSVLEEFHLPLELKYLAVIESDLKPSALSKVGAKGPWQLMPRTAHVLGLQVNSSSDERSNYYKSTRAAAKYLRDLHKMFGDWLLVLAAYNGGPTPVYRAIRKAHSRNFWVLQQYLPAESRLHVKKFIATAYYFEKNELAKPSAPPATMVSYASYKVAAPADGIKASGLKTEAIKVTGPTASSSKASAPAAIPSNASAPAANPFNASAPAANGTIKLASKASRQALPESDNDRFRRLMNESAQSLQKAHELLDMGN